MRSVYPDVTLVVVPRERFSFAVESLESIRAATPGPLNLVYVDGCSPRRVRSSIDSLCRGMGGTVVRSERFLSPNEARNIGLRHARTQYVVFLDNDVVCEPGWLDALLACAQETGAPLVAPLYLEHNGVAALIHVAGGEVAVREEHGRRVLFETHPYVGVPFTAAPPLERGPCGKVEFHCLLARTALFEALGPLDEGLLSLHEHLDLTLIAREHGYAIFFEPRSVVTYVHPMRLAVSDLPYFMLRWSERWNNASAAHFNAKWRLDPEHPLDRAIRGWAREHRWTFLDPMRRKKSAPRRRTALADRLRASAEWRFNRALVPLSLQVARLR